MRTVADLLSYHRGQTGTGSDVVDATLLEFLNIGYHALENAIVNHVNEDYFYELFTTDTVADQNEYVLEESTPTNG